MLRKTNISLWVSLLFSLLFLFSSFRASAQVVEILLFLTVLVCWWIIKVKRISLVKIETKYKLMALSMAGFFFIYTLCYFYSQGITTKLSALNPYINYFICALILIMLLKLPISLNKKVIFCSIGLAGIINGLFAIYQGLILDIGRVYGAIGIFKFSQVSGAIAIFTTMFYLFSSNMKEKIFYLVATLLASSVVFLSVTRGTILGLLIAYIIIFSALFFAPASHKKRAFLNFIFLCCLYIIGAIGLIVIDNRKDAFGIGAFQNDMSLYQQNKVHSSNGLRLEMWKEAIAIFKLSPIFGMHSKLVDQNLEEIIALSKTRRTFNELLKEEDRNPNPALYPKREAIVKAIAQNRHNQFFDTLASSGILGVTALFMMIAMIIVVFWKNLRSSNVQSFQIAWIGLGILFLYGGCSAGDVPFSSNFLIPFMMIIFILLAKLQNENQQCNNPSL